MCDANHPLTKSCPPPPPSNTSLGLGGGVPQRAAFSNPISPQTNFGSRHPPLLHKAWTPQGPLPQRPTTAQRGAIPPAETRMPGHGMGRAGLTAADPSPPDMVRSRAVGESGTAALGMFWGQAPPNALGKWQSDGRRARAGRPSEVPAPVALITQGQGKGKQPELRHTIQAEVPVSHCHISQNPTHATASPVTRIISFVH